MCANGEGLRAWLQYLRIDKYYEQISAAGHDAHSLAQLSDEELSGLGLPLGPRKKIRLNAGLMLQSCNGGNEVSAPLPGPGPSSPPQHAPGGQQQPHYPAPEQRPQPLPPSRLQPLGRPFTALLAPPVSASKQPSPPRPAAGPQAGPQLPPALHPRPCSTTPSGPSLGGGSNSSTVPAATSRMADVRTDVTPVTLPGGQAAGAPHINRQGRLPAVPPSNSPSRAAGANCDPRRAPPPQQQHHQQQPRQPQQPPRLSTAAAGAPNTSSNNNAGTSAPAAAAAPPQSAAPAAAPFHSDGVGSGAACDAPQVLSAAAAAERRALARLYPSTATAGMAEPTGSDLGGRQAHFEGGAAVGADAGGPCPGAAKVDNAAVPTPAYWALGVTRGRSVLKRSRSWDGSQPPVRGDGLDAHHLGRGAAAPRQQPMQPRPQWRGGQGLYVAAASERPVDCSFRALRSASRPPSSHQQQQQRPGSAVPDAPGPGCEHADSATRGNACSDGSGGGAPGARTGAPGAGQEATAAARSLGAQHPPATQPFGSSVGQNAAVARLPNVSAGHGAGSGAQAVVLGHADRNCGTHGPVNPHRVAGAGSNQPGLGPGPAGGSLLDDPRNFETPELLAQLLYDDEAAAVVATAYADGFVGHAEPGPAAGPFTALAGVDGVGRSDTVDAARAVVAAATEGDAMPSGGSGDDVVTREQRLARLRALREEVAATERLLETLRGMIADEERALAAGGYRQAGEAGVATSNAISGRRVQLPHGSEARPQQAQVHQLQQQPATQQGQPGPSYPGRQAAQEQRPQLQSHVRMTAGDGSVGRMGHDEVLTVGEGRDVGDLEVPVDWDEPPTQRWDSGMMLVERLEMLA